MAPFIFEMKDNTFDKWMTVQQMSEEGLLIYSNRQHQFFAKPYVDRTTWHLKRRFFKHLQGLVDRDLMKLATFLIEGRKVSLFPEKKNDKHYNEELSKQWKSVEEYCIEKKYKRIFECICLKVFTDKSKIQQFKNMEKAERKEKFRELKAHYHLDKEKIVLLREAIGEQLLKMGMQKSNTWVDLIERLPVAFETLVESIQKSVDEDGNLLVVEKSDMFILESSIGFGKKKFFKELSSRHEKSVDFFYFDGTITENCRRLDISFFQSFFKATSRIGSSGHRVVLVLNPLDLIPMVRGMSQVTGYVSIPAQYIKRKLGKSGQQALLERDGRITDYVHYIFFNERFEEGMENKVAEKEIKNALRGNILNFEEIDEQDSILGERDPRFYDYLTKLLLTPGDSVVIFGEGRQFMKCLLVRLLSNSSSLSALNICLDD